MFDCIIAGCGFAGAVAARRLADKAGKKVLIIEKRNHVGGSAFDQYDEHGVLIHLYGPHIFHTNNERVFKYLSNYTEWREYHHEVLANIHGNYVPVPFNLNTLFLLYEKQKAENIKEKLIEQYSYGSRVPIWKLQKSNDEDIKGIADFIYHNIFLRYTMKQWGKKPEEIAHDVIGRVPILISYDNGYFQDTYQGMPKLGYTELFKQLLNHPNIELRLGADATQLLDFDDKGILFEEETYHGDVIYTGAIDELLGYRYGKLPYRTLDFDFEHHNVEGYQPAAVVNYTVSEEFTRITEFKKLTGQIVQGTTILKEYPKDYTDVKGQIPYYPVNNEKNDALYNQYVNAIKKYGSFYLLGRLAEYKYYNMDSIVEKALDLSHMLAKC